MPYSIKTWQDHIVQYPNRYTQVANNDDTVTQEPAPGEVIQQGTPQSATNFNNLEEGVFAANEMTDYLLIGLLQIMRELDASGEEYDERLLIAGEMLDYLAVNILQLRRGISNAVGESGTITITNARAWPFNDSGSTVALRTPRDTADYTVTVEVQSVTGGAVGEVSVSNKLLNGFKLSFDGSATEVVVRYNVTGGNV